MKVSVVPFLTPPDSAVSHSGWQLTTPEGDSPLPPEMPHWDYQTTLDLSAAVSVDRRVVTDSCGLEPECGLSVLITAHSSHTRTERPVALLDVPIHQDLFDLAIQVQLEGHELGGRLTLGTSLVVTDPRPTSALAPAQTGSILWRVAHHTHLEGVGAQFPTEAADFALTRPATPDAGWFLEVDVTDVDVLFMSAARLTLNSSHELVRSLLEGRRDAATERLRRTLQWDVTRQLVHLALGNEEVLFEEVDLEGTTTGAVLRNLLAAIWPHDEPVTLQGWLSSDPARIELKLQSHCGLLG